MPTTHRTNQSLSPDADAAGSGTIEAGAGCLLPIDLKKKRHNVGSLFGQPALSLEELAQYWQECVWKLKRMFPHFTVEDCEDIVASVFLRLTEKGVFILGWPCRASLHYLMHRAAIDFGRRMKTIIRGGGLKRVCWEDVTDLDLYKHGLGHCGSPREQVELVSLILAEIRHAISAREVVCLRLLMEYLPAKPLFPEALTLLTGEEKLRFLPHDGRPLSEKEQERWMVRQVTRSLSSLRAKIKAFAEGHH